MTQPNRQGANRRDFLKTTTALAATAALPYWFTTRPAFAFQEPSNRPLVGCIGTGDRWKSVGSSAMKFGDVIALCDVDKAHLEEAERIVKDRQPNWSQLELFEDYRHILDNKDIEVVTIVTPDHWHTKIAIEAMKAGKDVYCEKPLTLTIEEGKQICKVARETGRVFQVGTQQRSGMGQRFLQAIAIARAGRLGDVKKITCVINGVTPSGPIPTVDPPATLDWEKWLGQAPLTDYRYQPTKEEDKEGNLVDSRWGNSNCHYEFRWWYQYSGGKMTDWGAHHVDIAQWLIDQTGEGQGPTLIVPNMVEHPVPLDSDGNPTQDDQYNVATKFEVEVTFPNDVTVVITSEGDNGLLIEGTDGRIFVSRGSIKGKPVEDLESNPLPEGIIAEVYKGKEPHAESKETGMGDTDVHMHNFMDCVASREEPISDVFSHHRAITTCHLANIALRLGRPVKWDPAAEQIVDDDQARAMQGREQRQGYEIEA